MNDFQLVIAPAGSGKSTEIRRQVRDWSIQRPFDKMLCITYTNRAADELKAEISSSYVTVSTIHSFMNSLAQSLFSAPEIVAYYFEVYGDDIRARILNAGGSGSIEASNARYREIIGDPLSFELVKESIKSLSYNQKEFNSLYRGGLSHDDLLSFVALCARRFPSIYRRVNAKYRRVIIDEYQDTDANVLEFFIEALRDSGADLFLYGDRMQQIYKADLERFQSLTNAFVVPRRKVINYRSTKAIVSLLNSIYNDQSLQQTADSDSQGTIPKAYFSSTPIDTVNELADVDTLILNVHNSSIFAAIGGLELFKALKDMPEHGHNSRYPAVSVLTEPNWQEVPNELLRLLYGLLDLESDYMNGRFGSVITSLRTHSEIFGEFHFYEHEDKARLSGLLDELFYAMHEENASIKGVLEKLSLLFSDSSADVIGYLENEKYAVLVLVPFQQVRIVFNYRLAPSRSTQHGVKGESHNKVLFVAESSGSPLVKMKTLFDIWPKIELNLNILEGLLGTLAKAFRSAIDKIGVDVSNLNRETFPAVEAVITAEARVISNLFSESKLFGELYGTSYSAYFKRPGVTNAKKLFKLSALEGLLAAYRLFYVGCSRARTELSIVIPLTEVDDQRATADKLRQLGFEIIEGIGA